MKPRKFYIVQGDMVISTHKTMALAREAFAKLAGNHTDIYVLSSPRRYKRDSRVGIAKYNSS